ENRCQILLAAVCFAFAGCVPTFDSTKLISSIVPGASVEVKVSGRGPGYLIVAGSRGLADGENITILLQDAKEVRTLVMNRARTKGCNWLNPHGIQGQFSLSFPKLAKRFGNASLDPRNSVSSLNAD
ncbi:MAG TPA: hypothetical protein VK968_13330, partial [Roseimicrobium sp.]|nr:hypothetical protein [Roseimicrobium sp.]